MTTAADLTTVRVDVTVDAPQARAFAVFTEDFDAVKPREHNLLEVDVAETVLERREGGAVYDRGVDGSVCRWGRVLAFEPPRRLVLSWDISPRWEVEPDHARTSEVEITFVALGADRTRVELVHSHLDRHGEGWETYAARLGSPDAWPLYLSRYGDVVLRDAVGRP